MRNIFLSFLVVAGSIVFCLTSCNYSDQCQEGRSGESAPRGESVQTPKSGVNPDGLETVSDQEGESRELRTILEYDRVTKKYQVRLLGKYEPPGTYVMRYHLEEDGPRAQQRYFIASSEFRQPRYMAERIDYEVEPGKWYEYAYVRPNTNPKIKGDSFLTDRLYVYVAHPDSNDTRPPNPFLK